MKFLFILGSALKKVVFFDHILEQSFIIANKIISLFTGPLFKSFSKSNAAFIDLVNEIILLVNFDTNITLFCEFS